MNLESYQKLKRRVDSLTTESNKIEGQYENILQQIKDDFGCESVSELRKLQNRLNKKVEVLETRFNEKLQELEINYKEELEKY